MGSINYEFIGDRVQGAAHKKNHKPCQDAVYMHSFEGGGVMAAVADGHGSDSCPYSDEGSQAAVESVYELFTQILKDAQDETFATLSANKDIWLPKRIENAWKQKIKTLHDQKHPDEDEMPLAVPQLSDLEIYHLYGTTVLGVLVADNFIFALQLGDGDIVYVDTDGQIRWLIEPDYMEGGETYSICVKDSWKHMKTYLLPLEGEAPPAMIMLSTDGYANSFVSNDGFLKAVADIHGMLKQDGADYVRENLRYWLDNSSLHGSGDDITVALVYAKE